MAGKKSTTKTATSYGYGVKFQTNARLKLKAGKQVYVFRSNYEKQVAQNLLKNKIKFQYEPKAFSYYYPVHSGSCFDCNSTNVGRKTTFTPDFFLTKSNVWVETKGKWDGKGRTKILSVLESDNELTRKNFRMLFMYDNWLTKKKYRRYTDWCADKSIICAVGRDIPEGWVK